jgi:hypothetical protein
MNKTVIHDYPCSTPSELGKSHRDYFLFMFNPFWIENALLFISRYLMQIRLNILTKILQNLYNSLN